MWLLPRTQQRPSPRLALLCLRRRGAVPFTGIPEKASYSKSHHSTGLELTVTYMFSLWLNHSFYERVKDGSQRHIILIRVPWRLGSFRWFLVLCFWAAVESHGQTCSLDFPSQVTGSSSPVYLPRPGARRLGQKLSIAYHQDLSLSLSPGPTVSTVHTSLQAVAFAVSSQRDQARL